MAGSTVIVDSLNLNIWRRRSYRLDIFRCNNSFSRAIKQISISISYFKYSILKDNKSEGEEKKNSLVYIIVVVSVKTNTSVARLSMTGAAKDVAAIAASAAKVKA